MGKAESAMKTEDKSVKDQAKEKLEEELKTALDKGLAEPVIGYLQKRILESDSLASDICQKHKTWKNCRDYIYSQARKRAAGSSTSCVRDDVVYEWAEDYFHLDDKAAEEEKAKKAAEQVKKGKEAATKKRKEMKQKQQEEKAKPTVQKVEKPEPEKKEEKPKKKSKDLEGQMDFFSMLGM